MATPLPDGCQPGNWPARICILEQRVAELFQIIEGGGTGTPITYWGRSTDQVLTPEQVLALARSGAFESSAGEYPIAAGSGYWYFVVPVALTPPTTIKITSSGLPLPLAASPGQPDYNQTTNGLTHAPVVVNGVPCRIYRSFNTLAGAGGITVT